MPVFQSLLAARDEAFAGNREHMLALLGELGALQARTEAASAKSGPRFAKRGQLLPRGGRTAPLLTPATGCSLGPERTGGGRQISRGQGGWKGQKRRAESSRQARVLGCMPEELD